MNWTTFRKWAKENNYKVTREIKDEDNNPFYYEWVRADNTERKGSANSLSQLVRDVFNDKTDNKHVAHQLAYREEQKKREI